MRRTLLLGGLLAAAGTQAGDLSGLKVHMLSGNAEYHSKESLARWADHLERAHGVKPTLSHAPDKAREAPGLHVLATAEVLVVFCRRWELEGEQAERVRTYVASGRPILGIRTASHAFNFIPAFDAEVLGGDYQGHGKGNRELEVTVVSPDHPAVAGVAGWTRIGKPYWNPDPAEDVHVLLQTQVDGRTVPLAWTRTASGRRVFYTSMGLPADFENQQFVRLLDHALRWVAGNTTATDQE